jgi:single-strand DNA-binding protein
MNTITIAGHVGRDPESRFTPSGQKVTNFTIAVNGRKGKDEYTVWYRIVVWGDRFDKMMPYIKKGSPLIIIGELGKPEIYTDKEGRPQISLEINAELLKFSPFGMPDKRGGDQQNQTASQHVATQHSQPYAGGGHDSFGEYSAPSKGQSYASSGAGEEPLPF